MKDKILMSKNNGNTCVGVPLFRHHYSEDLGKLEGYSVALVNDKPLAWILDIGTNAQVVNAIIVEKQMEILADL